MYDFVVDTIHTLLKNGVTLSSVGAIIFLLFKHRKMKKRLHRYFPWLFSNEIEVTDYINNQRRIMANQERIMSHLGVESCGTIETYNEAAPTSLKKSLVSSLATCRQHKQKRRVVRMGWLKNINKAILIPFLSAIALFVKQAFGYEIPDEWVESAANMVLLIVMAAGLFIRPKKDNGQNQSSSSAEERYYYGGR